MLSGTSPTARQVSGFTMAPTCSSHDVHTRFDMIDLKLDRLSEQVDKVLKGAVTKRVSAAARNEIWELRDADECDEQLPKIPIKSKRKSMPTSKRESMQGPRKVAFASQLKPPRASLIVKDADESPRRLSLPLPIDEMDEPRPPGTPQETDDDAVRVATPRSNDDDRPQILSLTGTDSWTLPADPSPRLRNPMDVTGFAATPFEPVRHKSRQRTVVSRQNVSPMFYVSNMMERRQNSTLQVIWSFIEDPTSSTGAQRYNRCFNAFVAFSAMVTLSQCDSEPSIDMRVSVLLESVIDVVFALEAVLRIATCPNRLGLFTMPFVWLDLAAALPIFLRWAHGWQMENIDTISGTVLYGLVPMLRLLKMIKHFFSLRLLYHAFELSLEALPMLAYCMIIQILLFSVIFHLVESPVNDSVSSLSDSIWVVTVTATTVGFGDITPVTLAGRFIAAVIMFVSMLMLAIPVGIIGMAFNEVWEKRHSLLLIHQARYALVKWGYDPGNIRCLFEAMDRDGNGVLDVEEFVALLSLMQIGLTHKQAQMIFEVIDKDGSGELDYVEFVTAIFPDCELHQQEEESEHFPEHLHRDRAASVVNQHRQTAFQNAGSLNSLNTISSRCDIQVQ
eukprot:TRINITY_DN13760_c0_g1_i1.p1 TRINITY_DN13760_c0_g1~~TRINITY_DN13760_c0_g1_i1.p1  ORF type:complete len:618 (+),score=86.17 TRINITY_DN13760_c0_g1_i1:166-2019(+)